MSLYQPFLEQSLDLLRQQLPLEPYPIPPEFEHQRTSSGKGRHQSEILTTSHAYQSNKLRQIRAAHVQGGPGLQVLNLVIFPHLNYDLPFFGADLVSLPGGHLIALDLQPLFPDDPQYIEHYHEPLRPTFAHHQHHLPWGGDFPTEAQPFFSPLFLWTRPAHTETVETHVLAAHLDYLNYYIKCVNNAQPITDPNQLKAIEAAQLRYVRYRAAKDPARGMFKRYYGETWTEAYIHQFLFNLEQHLQQSPTAGQ
jgi:phycoerythrobilin:ferredoxin oxidoreductase